jgi:hypothetical protein
MGRRSISILLTFALVLQALLVAPGSFASGIGARHAASQSHCSEHMPSGKQECPCCPDGASAVGGCLTLCAGSATAVTLAVVAFDVPTAEAIPFVPAASLTYTHAPPDPPPIV